MNIILDLDQTLISAEAYEDYDKKKNKRKQKMFRYGNMDDYYLVFERPDLQPFLDFLFKNFNVSIWTAASKDYALYIIQNMVLNGKKERTLDYIFFSYHCDISKRITKKSKNLKVLWEQYGLENYNKSNTFILDDYSEVYNTQKSNCIFMKPFEFEEDGSENDIFLKKLIPKLKQLNKQGDTSLIPSINDDMKQYF